MLFDLGSNERESNVGQKEWGGGRGWLGACMGSLECLFHVAD